MNIANRGTQNKVTILKEIKDDSMTQTLYEHETEVLQESPYDPSVFDPIIQGMVEASRVGTAAYYFGSYPVDVASKTGTPETADLPNSTFICFAPADDPQIAISVVIEQGWHGYTGAPVARLSWMPISPPMSPPRSPPVGHAAALTAARALTRCVRCSKIICVVFPQEGGVSALFWTVRRKLREKISTFCPFSPRILVPERIV